MTWSREEDFTHDQYRPMASIRIRAGVDAAGSPSGWWDRMVSPSILFQRGWIPAGAVDGQAVDGAVALPYAMADRLVEYVRHPAAVPVGFWRSVGNSLNCFAVESAVDELALAVTSSLGSYVAQVAEVSSVGGAVKVERVWCAVDCGRVVNPDTVEAQMQGGIVHGLTATLWGKMSFNQGQASPDNFDRYRMMRMRDMPVSPCR